MFFKVKKNSKLALKKGEIKDFKIGKKIKLLKKLFQSSKRSYLLNVIYENNQ